MEPSVIGPYILLGLGAAAVIAAIAGHFKKLAAKSALLMWIFGTALLGIGSYGPAFLADYVGFVKALNQVTEAPGGEQVAEFLDRAGKAGVSTAAREAILVDVLSRETPAAAGAAAEPAAEVYDGALQRLPESSENRAVLKEARSRVEAEKAAREFTRRRVAAEAASPEAGPSNLAARDLEPLLRLRPDQLRRLEVDREALDRARTRSGGGG